MLYCRRTDILETEKGVLEERVSALWQECSALLRQITVRPLLVSMPKSCQQLVHIH